MLSNWFTDLARRAKTKNIQTVDRDEAKSSHLKQRSRRARVAAAVAAATEPLESRTLFSVVAWTGLGASDNWSDSANWDAAPVAGDDLLFLGGSQRLSNVNDFAPGTHFSSLVIDDAGYTLTGNSIALDNIGVSTTYASGVSTIGFDVELSADQPFDIASGGELDVTGVVSGPFGLSKTNGGTLALSGGNTYSGVTSVLQGIVQAKSDDALGSTAGATTVSGAASVYFSGNGLNVAEDFDVSGGGVGGTGAVRATSGSATLGGAISLGANTTIGTANNATLALTGSLTDSAGSRVLSVVNSSAGRTTLAEDGSNFSGSITLNTGYLRVGSNTALGSASNSITFPDNASLEVDSGVTIPANKTLIVQLNGVGSVNPKIYGLSGNNVIDSGIVFQGNTEINVATGASLAIDGAISQNASGRRLISDGQGELILNGANTYSGTTFVTAGALRVDGSIAASSDVQIFGGALTGAGTVPAVTVNSGGAVAPGGGSTGVLSSGNATFNSGSTFNVDLNGTTVGTDYDQLDVAGAATMGGVLGVSLAYAATAGDTYVILANDGVDPVNGAFSGLAEGATFQVGNQPVQISYVGGDGNDIVLTALSRVSQWTGLGGSNLWSDAGNWVGGVAPTAGDAITFPAGASRLSNVNDFTAGTHFDSITVDAAGYNLTGNAITLDGGITASYASGASTIGFDVGLGADQTFDIASGGELDVTGVVSGAHVLTKGSAGTLVLSGANTYSGGTTIADGVAAISDDSALGTGQATINYPGELSLSGDITVANGIQNRSAGTAIHSVSGDNVISGPIDEYEYTRIDVAASSTLDLTGVISQSNPGRSLTKAGAGVLQIDAANSYSGGTDIQAGTLKVTHAQALGTSGLIYDESGATLLVAAATFDAPSGGIYMGGSVTRSTIAIDDSSSHTLNGAIHLIGNANFDVLGGGLLTVASAIDGTGTVNLSASSVGTLIIAGTSSYAGKTFVAGGTLQVDGNLSSSQELDLLGGALTGAGHVGKVVATGGVVTPGGVGTDVLTTGDLTLSIGSTYSLRVNGVAAGAQYDQLSVAGTVAISGALSINTGYAPSLGDSYTIIANDGSDAIVGSFAGLAEGAVFAVGGDSFKISYVAGDGNDVSVTAVTASNTAVASAPNPSVFGQSVTFTATVTDSGPTPTGSVTWMVDGMLAGVTALDGSGQATLVLSSLATGSHSVTAAYGGDSQVAGSTSSVFSHTVAAASTTATLGASANPSEFGESVTLTATIAPVAPGAGTPSGSVSFFDGATLIGTSALNGSGQATLATANLSVGSHSLTAVYAGAADFSGSTSAVHSQTVAKASSAVSVNASGGATLAGDSASFTAVVAPAGAASATPTGSVEFFDGATSLGVVALDNAGQASLATAALTVGSHNITVQYAGDALFAGGVSSPIAHVVTGGAPAFSSADAATFTVGQAGAFFVTAVGAPTPTIALSGALPAGVTFDPATGLLAGTPAAGATGEYALTLTANNLLGVDAQTLNLTVNEVPAITSAATANFAVGAASAFNITTTGMPRPTFSIVGALPAGLTFTDFGDGHATVAGTPASGTTGNYSIVVTADNGVGVPATQTVAIAVAELPPPTVIDHGMTIASRGGKIAALTLTFDQALQSMPSAGSFTLVRRVISRSGEMTRVKPVRLAGVDYDPQTQTVTVKPQASLRSGRIYELTADSSQFQNMAGISLDGANTGEAGSPLTIRFARGRSISYTDHDGDRVRLSLRGPGAMDLVFGSNGEGNRLVLSGTTSRTSLRGSVAATRAGGTGMTTLQSIDGLGDGINLLGQDAFEIVAP